MTCWRRRYLTQLAIALGIFLFWMLGGLWLMRGAMRQFRSVTKRLVEERAAQKEEDKRLAKLAELQSTHDTILQDIGSIEPTPAKRLYQATLVTQLGQFAERNAVALLGVTPANGGAAQTAGLPELPKESPWRFVAVFSGHYNDLVKLVDSLQTFPKAVAVQSVNLRVDKALRDGTMRAEIVLLAREVPGVKDPATMTTVPVPPPTLMNGFNRKTIGDWLKSIEQQPAGQTPAEAPLPGALPPTGPALSAPGMPAAPLVTGGMAPMPGMPGKMPGAQPPLGRPMQPGGMAPMPGPSGSGPAPTLPPGQPFKAHQPPRPGGMAPPPPPFGAGAPPPPSTPNMLPGNSQSQVPDNLGPARSMANVGVVRRVYKIMRQDGLLPSRRQPVTDDGRVAATPVPAQGKTR